MDKGIPMHPVQWLVLLLAIATWLYFQILIEAMVFPHRASFSKKDSVFGFWAFWSLEFCLLIYVCTLFDLDRFSASTPGVKVAFVVLVLAWVGLMSLFGYAKWVVRRESKGDQQNAETSLPASIKRFIDRWGDQ